MLFKDITILDEDFEVRKHMYVGVTEDKITYIGESMPSKDYGEVYEGRSKLLMPGFFNIHAHSPMVLMRGYGEDMMLQDWLTKKIFPFEEHLTGKNVYAGTLLAMAESVKNGIVSTSDMYYLCEDMIRAVDDAGSKVNISRAITNFQDIGLMETQAGPEMKYLFENYNGACDGRVTVEMSLHAEYTNTEKSTRQLAELTKKLGAGMHVHVSETLKEVKECKERHQGRTPVRYLADMGIFDMRTVAAHCVHLEDDDFEILNDKNVNVASNVISNLKLASGVCNIPKLLRNGINVGIGTDSVASNNNLDFLEEIKIFAMAPKMYYNSPSEITVKEVIRSATLSGALAQGRYDTGAIKEGMKADLVIIDTSECHMHPVHNLLANLVYSASGSDVRMTMVDGRILYENGEFKTIDIEKAIFEVEKETGKILSKLKVR